ncbi:hypothetical protein AMTR_s00038p00226360 [Amborella trichopoda]|uniref:Uncharacterized protein n=1 Tax=Amborella trichopoda TaxID=13333 RepID=U5CNI2_AMBTC|nr:hypothetical protein AMTR_s00038p00226360 [Amborella trichopoda]
MFAKTKNVASIISKGKQKRTSIITEETNHRGIKKIPGPLGSVAKAPGFRGGKGEGSHNNKRSRLTRFEKQGRIKRYKSSSIVHGGHYHL